MQLNKTLKGLVIALPVMTMMACSSNNGSAQAGSESNAPTTESTTSSSSTSSTAGVETGQIERIRTPEEIKRDTLEELRNEQIIYFDFDRSSVSSEFHAVLDKHAQFLRKNPEQRIVVEGHCDNRGTPEYNIALGERRAKSIETYLKNSGVSAAQISVVSYGEEKPEVQGGSEAAFAKNRRGVLVYQ